ncbi:MAG: hypothetical protein KGL39_47880 [Patescibacteria group bacterium]|nr:hypothetical protein [Patescibacteria group bacterium]
MAWANPSAPNLPDFILFIQNSMGIPASALPANVTVPAAASLTANTSGGSLPTETVYVTLTYVTEYGETTASIEASIGVTGPTGQVIVASPAAQGGVTGYNVYAADATGAEVLQNGATPIAIGTGYTIDTLATGTAAAPTTNTASSPWPDYAFNQASALVLNIPTVTAIEYVLAVYNCGGHILLRITPDQSGQTYFQDQRKAFLILDARPGVIAASSDESTSQTFQVIENFKNLTVGDLNFYCTPWGREYLSYQMDFGAICGLS